MIQCPNCYAQNADGSVTCYNCRTPLAPARASDAPAYAGGPAGYVATGAVAVPISPPTSTMAIVSLVFGILGLVGVLPLIGSIVAAITGHMALNDIRRRPTEVGGGTLARVGMILGYIGIALGVIACLCGIIYLIFVLGLVATSGST